MQNRNDDPQPLLTHTAQLAADRLAMVRSLTPERTGLSVRRNNCVVKLLEVMSHPTYSDGTQTFVRKATLAKHFHVNQSTIFRWIKAAQEIGVIVSQVRTADDGREVSSLRAIQWSRVAELARTVTAAPAETNALGTRANALGTRANALGTRANALPVFRSNSKHSKANLRSGGKTDKTSDPTDLENSKPVDPGPAKPPPPARQSIPATALVDRVRSLAESIGYRGTDAGTLWQLAAAESLGLIAERSLSDAASAVRESRGSIRRPVAYVRSVTADNEAISGDDLAARLRTIRITPRTPRSPPPPMPKRKNSPVGIGPTNRETNDRRNAFLDQLQQVTQ